MTNCDSIAHTARQALCFQNRPRRQIPRTPFRKGGGRSLDKYGYELPNPGITPPPLEKGGPRGIRISLNNINFFTSVSGPKARPPFADLMRQARLLRRARPNRKAPACPAGRGGFFLDTHKALVPSGQGSPEVSIPHSTG